MEICMDIQILNRQHRTLMHRYQKAKYTKFYPDPLRIHIHIGKLQLLDGRGEMVYFINFVSLSRSKSLLQRALASATVKTKR